MMAEHRKTQKDYTFEIPMEKYDPNMRDIGDSVTYRRRASTEVLFF